MTDSFVFKRCESGAPVARGVHVYLRPLTDPKKLELARERFSRKGFESDEVVPGAIWEVATNVWCAYEPGVLGGFSFYEPLPPPVYTRSGVLLQED